MAQQMITLEEAAVRLGISPEEMKKRLKTDSDFKKLSQIRDGSTVRFKVSAVDELARQLGMASEDGLPLPPIGDETPDSEDFKVQALDNASKKAPKKPENPTPEEIPLDFGNAEDDVFSLAEDGPKAAIPSTPKSSGRLTPDNAATAPPGGVSDSSFEGSSDSDVRLDGDKAKKKTAEDEAAVPTEEIALDFSGPGSAVSKGGSSAKLSAPKTGGSSGKLDKNKGKGNTTPNDSSSEFELSLDADSDDFDLQMSSDDDSVDLGGLPVKDKTSSSGKRGSQSGINLSDPADSGISLEKGKTDKKAKDKTDKKRDAKKEKDDSDAADVDFELSLDSSSPESNTNLGAPKSGKLVLESDSDSEFELTLDDSGGSLEQAALEENVLEDVENKGDIFETDFEIPSMPDESASEAVVLESDTDLEKDDFEIAIEDNDVVPDEDSGSEVVILDDEDENKPAKGKPKPKGKPKSESTADVDVDLADDSAADEDESSVSKALKGAKAAPRGSADTDADPADFAATKPWGIVPVLFLAPALLFTLVGALMGFELLQTMWGYQQPRKPTAPLVRALATQLDMELKDQ